ERSWSTLRWSNVTEVASDGYGLALKRDGTLEFLNDYQFPGRYSNLVTMSGSGALVMMFDPPFAVTESPSSVSTNSATLAATINPNGTPTFAYFEYDPYFMTPEMYFHRTLSGFAGNGVEAVPFGLVLT